MKVIAVYSVKGGVGKTASAVNLSFVASQNKANVLLIDMDPQAASTFYFKLKQGHEGKIKKNFFGSSSLEDFIKETEFTNLDILPADSRYRKLDVLLSDMKNSDSWLKKLLKPVKANYDYIILDCPPNLTNLSENIFKNVDIILVPVIPSVLSVRTYDQLKTYFKDQKLDSKKLIPFYSMVEIKKNMHNDIMEEFSKQHSECLNIAIPYNTIVERMGEYLLPVSAKFPLSETADLYQKLWKKLKKVVDE
jgi:cellulose biosynthesis protein BcsQ